MVFLTFNRLVAMSESEICVRENGSRWLVHPDYLGEATGAWFDPSYWGSQACLVSSGGRGSAWFITTEAHKMVLRQYRRGGLMSRMSENTYAFAGEPSVRSFSEFRLLNRLVSLGLPVPRPVAAFYTKTSLLTYRAVIIVEKLERTTPLASKISDLDERAWQTLGGVIRKFHNAGLRHADLNCFNVLVREEEFFLIDFDKGRFMPSGGPDGWKATNLNRFARSLRKVAGNAEQSRVWEFFMLGYNRSQPA